MADANGNGELTKEVLRAELRAGLAEQSLGLRNYLDERLKPVNEHILRIDAGEMTDAQKGAIVTVMREEHANIWKMRGLKIPFAAIFISMAAFIASFFN